MEDPNAPATKGDIADLKGHMDELGSGLKAQVDHVRSDLGPTPFGDEPHVQRPRGTRRRRGNTAPQSLLQFRREQSEAARRHLDRKSTRLNSSHLVILYAVFWL